MTVNNTYEITIDFVPGVGDPSRIFRAMSGIIDSFKDMDSLLFEALNVPVRPTIVLEDVEKGSLKAIIKGICESIPDEALKEGEVKKILGALAFEGKKKIVKWCSENEEIKKIEDIKELESGLNDLIEKSKVGVLASANTVDTEKVLQSIQSLQEGVSNLYENDQGTLKAHEETFVFNQNLQVSDDVISDVLTMETTERVDVANLLVKKPDYLGKSMWVFQCNGKTFDAKITDFDWLNKFQNRAIDIRPGDSLNVKMKEITYYGYKGEILNRNYEIIGVKKEITPLEQMSLDGDGFL